MVTVFMGMFVLMFVPMFVLRRVMMINFVPMGELMPSTLLAPTLVGGPPLLVLHQSLHDIVRTQIAVE